MLPHYENPGVELGQMVSISKYRHSIAVSNIQSIKVLTDWTVNL